MSVIGNKYNLLTVISEPFPVISENGHKRAFVMVLCDCGREKRVNFSRIKTGGAKSCGCLIEKVRTKHGLVKHPLYKSYSGMLQRCYNNKHRGYKNYGAKGITICKKWLNSFKSFYDWAIQNGWANGLLLDRISNKKGYSPQNCRYVTMKKSNENRSCTLYVTYNGERRLLKEWASILGRDYNYLRKDLFVRKIPARIAFTKTVIKHRANQLIKMGGRSKTLTQWCDYYGVNLKMVWNRINNLGWDIKNALTRPLFTKTSEL